MRFLGVKKEDLTDAGLSPSKPSTPKPAENGPSAAEQVAANTVVKLALADWDILFLVTDKTVNADWCEAAQGFGICKPLELCQMRDWLEDFGKSDVTHMQASLKTSGLI